MYRQRILFVIQALDRSGAEKQLALLASNLPRSEFDVEVAVLTRGGEFEFDLLSAGVRYHLIGKRFKIDPFAFFRLKRIMRQFQPDIVHTWLFAGNSYGRLAAILCGVKGIIAGERCVDLWKSGYQFLIDKFLGRWTDFIVTNSCGVKDFYAQHGLPPEKFVIIPNAVITPENNFSNNNNDNNNNNSGGGIIPFSREEFLCRLGVNDSAPVGGYVPVNNPDYDFDRETYFSVSNESLLRRQPYIIGIVSRLWAQKRVTDALWVFESLRFLDLHFHAVVIGDGPERDMLLRYRDEWGLSDCVHFLGHCNNVIQMIPNFDLLLNFSAYEGQSNSILEAMSFGVPVIATDIPGNNELVVNGETGILIPDTGNDFRKLRRNFVREILTLLENEQLRTKMGIAAKKRVTEHFNLKKMIEQHITLYNSLNK
ncbi:MAG: glycosyltransferase [Planctomycetaceae bacterium]|jgi:glycosyltransferase involved in cell wall biosynthesis|nr:glycosyltransferase [Planctomycetaceae bacterium]